MAKITVFENLGIMPKKPTGNGFHYEVQIIGHDGKTFYRRQKIKTKTGLVSSCAYAYELDAKRWESALYKM